MPLHPNARRSRVEGASSGPPDSRAAPTDPEGRRWPPEGAVGPPTSSRVIPTSPGAVDRPPGGPLNHWTLPPPRGYERCACRECVRPPHPGVGDRPRVGPARARPRVGRAPPETPADRSWERRPRPRSSVWRGPRAGPGDPGDGARPVVRPQAPLSDPQAVAAVRHEDRRQQQQPACDQPPPRHRGDGGRGEGFDPHSRRNRTTRKPDRNLERHRVG